MGFKIDKEINDSGVIAGHWELETIHIIDNANKYSMCSYAGYIDQASYSQGKNPIKDALIYIEFKGDDFVDLLSNGLNVAIKTAFNNKAKNRPEFQGAIEQ